MSSTPKPIPRRCANLPKRATERKRYGKIITYVLVVVTGASTLDAEIVMS